MTKPLLSLCAVVVFVAACGTTVRYTPTNRPPRPMQPRPPETVDVFTATAPNVPFVEVGILQARQSSEFSFDDMPGIIRELRIQAAQIGCDGVVINGASDKIVDTSVDGEPSPHTLEGFWGACIMYAEPEAHSAAH